MAVNSAIKMPATKRCLSLVRACSLLVRTPSPTLRKLKCRHQQRGALLIELAVVLSVILLMAVYAVSAFNQRHAELRIQGLALWMDTVQHAFKRYINEQGVQINTKDYKVAGVQVALEPTVVELKSLGYLKADFPLGVAQRYEVKLVAFGDPACSQADCAIYGLVWVPAVVKSNHDFAYWKLNTAAAGAIITAQRPDYISAAHSELSNPPEAGMRPIPPGSLALLIKPDDLGLSYLQVGDTRNPLFKNNASVGGELHAGDTIYAGKGLHMARVNTVGESCTEPGLLSRNRGASSLLICNENHSWQHVGLWAGGTFSMSMSGQCTHPVLGSTLNPVTNTCACPTGFVNVLIGVSGNTFEDTYLTYACSPK